MCKLCEHGIEADPDQEALAEINRVAVRNRNHLDLQGVFTIKLISSPGAGKATILEAAILALSDRYRIALVVRNPGTDHPVPLIQTHGLAAVQVSVGYGGHLDAHHLSQALPTLPLAGTDLLFIDSGADCSCPGALDLGQHRDVALLSPTEASGTIERHPGTPGASDFVVRCAQSLAAWLEWLEMQLHGRSARQLDRAPLIGGGAWG